MIWYFGASLILVLVFNSVYNLTPSFEYLSLRECTFVCHRLAMMRMLGCLFNQNDHKICGITPKKYLPNLDNLLFDIFWTFMICAALVSVPRGCDPLPFIGSFYQKSQLRLEM